MNCLSASVLDPTNQRARDTGTAGSQQDSEHNRLGSIKILRLRQPYALNGETGKRGRRKGEMKEKDE